MNGLQTVIIKEGKALIPDEFGSGRKTTATCNTTLNVN